jgi:hypothetical protein
MTHAGPPDLHERFLEALKQAEVHIPEPPGGGARSLWSTLTAGEESKRATDASAKATGFTFGFLEDSGAASPESLPACG